MLNIICEDMVSLHLFLALDVSKVNYSPDSIHLVTVGFQLYIFKKLVFYDTSAKSIQHQFYKDFLMDWIIQYLLFGNHSDTTL